MNKMKQLFLVLVLVLICVACGTSNTKETSTETKAFHVAVVLSGSGVFDGTEIHEAVATLLAIEKNDATYQIFAPNILQNQVVNHLSGEAVVEERNVLIESARIARGEVLDLKEFDAANFDALVFPGGFGAMKNLCNLALVGLPCEVNTDVENAIVQMHAAQKPIGALCISPVLLARVLGGVNVTLGTPDDFWLDALTTFGATHQNTAGSEICIDAANKIVSTPAYMVENNISGLVEGADNLLRELKKMAQ